MIILMYIFVGLKRKLTSKLGANSSAFVPNWQVLLLFIVKFGSWCLFVSLLLSFACILGKLQIGEYVEIW